MFHVDYVPHQTFGLRPLPELSDYRTPIEASISPVPACIRGPAITGLPGHNTAQVVIEDIDSRLRRSTSGGGVRTKRPGSQAWLERSATTSPPSTGCRSDFVCFATTRYYRATRGR